MDYHAQENFTRSFFSISDYICIFVLLGMNLFCTSILFQNELMRLIPNKTVFIVADKFVHIFFTANFLNFYFTLSVFLILKILFSHFWTEILDIRIMCQVDATHYISHFTSYKFCMLRKKLHICLPNTACSYIKNLFKLDMTNISKH